VGSKPKTRFKGQSAKVAKTKAPSSSQGERPHFCFRYADRATQEAWSFKPSEEHAPVLVEFICDMAQLTWGEIEAQRQGTAGNRHRRHHSQDIDSLTTTAQTDITKRKLSERFDDSMFRFRLSGEQRLWGFRRGRVFHVVWWDPDHQVYPTEKTQA